MSIPDVINAALRRFITSALQDITSYDYAMCGYANNYNVDFDVSFEGLGSEPQGESLTHDCN